MCPAKKHKYQQRAKAVLTNNGSVNDIMEFAKGSDITLANFVAVTLRVNVDNDWSDGDSIEFYGWDTATGTQVGDSIKLEDYFNFPVFDTWQSIVIPLADLALTSATTVDAFRIEIVAKSGAKSPKFYLDKIQIEASGGSEVFEVNVDKGNRLHIDELVFSYADDLSGTVSNGTMPGIAYDKILGIAALTNGFVITRRKKGKTLFSATVKTLGDHLSAGAKADRPWSDGTNTFVILRQIFKSPLVLSGDPDDTLTITVSDNLSGLLHFRVAARGGLENI